MKPIVTQKHFILSQIDNGKHNSFLMLINSDESINKFSDNTITVHGTISIACRDRNGEFLGFQKGPFSEISVNAAQPLSTKAFIATLRPSSGSSNMMSISVCLSVLDHQIDMSCGFVQVWVNNILVSF